MNINGRTINPGEMTTSVTLKTRTVSVETGGFEKPALATLATVWARWENAHGSEVWAAQSTGATRPATVLIRYLAGLDETCVVTMGGVDYEIVSIDNIRNRGEYLELKVQAMRPG